MIKILPLLLLLSRDGLLNGTWYLGDSEHCGGSIHHKACLHSKRKCSQDLKEQSGHGI
jgi:hypothetical protein